MRRPNFIVFLSDDQAYCDLGCMGATDLASPNLDGLAATGALLLSWYANSPVCSPSRASLLTGRYPGNAGVRSILRGHRTATGLPREVPTEDAIFLADLIDDPDERTNLRDRHREIASEMRAAAEAWRARIEQRWDRQWRARLEETGVTAWPAPGSR